MKYIKNSWLAFLGAIMLLVPACEDILEEEPRAILTPEYFETAAGLEAGLIAAYSYLRYFYGTEGGHNLTVYGTDEFTNGNQTTDPPLNTYVALTPDNGDILTPWNRAYPAINTLNGIIELAPENEMLSEAEKQSIIGEAKYLRAHWYFLLLQTFGGPAQNGELLGVTLDLGSGELAFNRAPSSNFERASLARTYEVIIEDLQDAVDLLPAAPRETGRVWKATALHLLSKVYLTRGWAELKYPELALDGNDFQRALETAQVLIPNASSPEGNFGARLLEDFALIFEEGNEYNAEALLTANRIGDATYNPVSGFGQPSEIDLQQNKANFFFRMFYTDFAGMVRDVANGRPWIRYKPTDWLLNEAFENKTTDSRFYKSFQTVWIANNPDSSAYPVWSAADAAAGYVDESEVGELKFYMGDTAVWYVPQYLMDDIADSASYGFALMTPRYVSSQKGHFPSLSKFDAEQRPVPGTSEDANITSTRSYIIYRLAETYLIAAEAALMLGNPALAAEYINTVRRRAAYPGQESAIEISAGEVDIDFILDERSRELAGEQKRWFDLVRTGSLEARAEAHNPDVVDVQPYHYTRPIPTTQIDLTENGYVQNVGYGQ